MKKRKINDGLYEVEAHWEEMDMDIAVYREEMQKEITTVFFTAFVKRYR